MRLFTIGFTRKSAEQFFTTLKKAGVERVLDVRLNNTSQLAGFSKRDDLRYFLKATGGMEYAHLPELAPTQDILDAYKKKREDWPTYEKSFLTLMEERKVSATLSPELFQSACLLCSEDQPDHCHRRLVAEHLREAWHNIEIIHL